MNSTSDWHAVYDFWFEDHPQELWFSKNSDFDRKILETFGPWLDGFEREAYVSWLEEPKSLLALVILLDQFPRNAFRGTARMFDYDAHALAVAKEGLGRGFEAKLTDREKWFLFMPFQHSESPDDQQESVRLFTALGDKSALDYAIRHQQIIERFGRFPHRNKILGRNSSRKELEFLTQPGSGF